MNKISKNQNSNQPNLVRQVKPRPDLADSNSPDHKPRPKLNSDLTRVMRPLRSPMGIKNQMPGSGNKVVVTNRFKRENSLESGLGQTQPGLAKAPAQGLDERTRRLSEAGIRAAQEQDSKFKPWEIDHREGAKVYKLVGYTTSARVDRKFILERRQRSLRKMLAYILAILILVLIVSINKPLKNVGEIKRMLGIESMMGNKQTE